MPIYEYRCESCGHQMEAIQKFSDPVLTECPGCGKSALKKLLSAAGFQLKGSGWYASDAKGSGGKKGDGKKSDGETGGSSDTGSKPHGCGGGSCGGCAH